MPKLTIGGDAKGAIKAITDLKKAQKEVADGGNKAEKSLTKMEKAARRIQEANAPHKRYNRQIKETALLANKGKISIDDAQRAVMRYGRNLDRAGRSGKQVFGPAALNNIGSYVTGVLSASAAIAGVKKILSELQQQQEAAASRTVQSLSGFGELAQISGTEEIFQRRKELAYKVIGRGIVKDEGQAATIGFKLDSADLNKIDTELLLKIGEQKLVKPEDLGALALATTTAQTAIGIKETGSRRDLINKGIEAAAHAPGNATQVLVGAAKYGTKINSLGYSDEAGLAALSVASQAKGTISEGSTLVNAALRAIKKAELSEGSFVGTVKEIKRRIEAGEGTAGILGVDDDEAITGVDVLVNNFEKFAQYKKDIDAAQAEDALAKQLGYLENDRVLGPALQKDKSAGKKRLAENVNLSPTQNLIGSIKDEHAARLIEEGSPSTAILNDIGTSASDLFGRDRGILLSNLKDERLPPRLRLKIAKRLRETTDDGASFLTSQSRIDTNNERYDRMIAILEAQLGIAQEMQTQSLQRESQQQARPKPITTRAQ